MKTFGNPRVSGRIKSLLEEVRICDRHSATEKGRNMAYIKIKSKVRRYFSQERYLIELMYRMNKIPMA